MAEKGKITNEDGHVGRVPGEDSCRGLVREKPLPHGAITDKSPDPLLHVAKDATNFMRSNGPVQEEFRANPENVELTFSSLADEEYRVYEWADGTAIRLDHPSKLNVSKSGGHRVYTMDGISHYIPSGWKHLWWKVRPGCPHFSF